MNEMREMKKILAIMLVSIMVCASVVIISPNNTVVAEDSAKPFADLSTGYPSPADVLDQEQTWNDELHGITLNDWYSQTFIPNMNGPLSKVSVYIWNFFGSGDLNCEIWTTDASHHPLAYLTGEIIADGTIPGSYDDWYDIEFSSPATLSSGVEYTIVMWCTGDIEYDWRCWGASDNYPNGDGYASWNSGASWDPPLGKDFCFKTYMDNGANGLKKIAWDANKTAALAVDGVTGYVYAYDRSYHMGGDIWWDLGGEMAPGGVCHDIVYDPNLYQFYIVGQDSNGWAAAWVLNYDTLTLQYSPTTTVPGAFYGVEYASGSEYNPPAEYYAFIAVGENTMFGEAYICWWDINDDIWYEESWALGDPSGDVLYDVAWDQGTGDDSYYCVGSDGGTGYGVVYGIHGWGGQAWDLRLNYGWTPFDPILAIDWRAPGSYGLMAGVNTNGYGCAYTITDGSSQPVVILNNSHEFRDLDWHPDGSYAIMVGDNGASAGVIYQFHNNTQIAADLTPLLPQGTQILYGITMKGYSSPSSGLIVGPSGAVGFYPSAVDTDTTITVNAAFPHNFGIDLWKTSDAGRLSKLNNQLLLETTYTFRCEVNYTISGVDQFYADFEDDVRVDLSAWYDEGATPSTAPVADDQHRTKMFNATWSEGGAPGADTAVMTYPILSPGTNEFLMDSWWLEAGPGDHYYIYMNITIGPQSWAADGTGFANGAASDINFANQALEDPNSWDFEMRVYDVNFAGATNSTYEEFGTFMFTNVTVSGNPAGNAPPGSTAQLGPNSQITCAANIDYYLNVSIPNLPRLGGGLPIDATYVSINTTSAYATDVNSMIVGDGVPFPGANQNLSIWGNTSQAAPGDWVVPAPLNSTTAHGPQGEDYQNIGATEIEWWIDVPGGTAEGIYQATITFKIGYY